MKANCLQCNYDYEYIKGTAKGKYCSHKCQRQFEYERYIRDWLNGKECGYYGNYRLCDRIRRFLFEKYEGKCSKCGWNEINPLSGKSPLEVEHLDGDASNCSEKNLTLLCPNCHSLSPTYKALNKGKSKRKYYITYRGSLTE